MKNPDKAPAERRRYIRIETPIEVSYATAEKGRINNITTMNISADGLRFQNYDNDIRESAILELKLNIPGAVNPVHAKGKVIWKKKVSLEDRAPSDVGVELSEVEEDNKNTFLKFLCNLIYELPKETRYAKVKK